jgi:predicted RNA binding protein YcfA (HicA-like mRNA interferase family)
LTAAEAEKLLLEHGFLFVRAKGSHRIYMKGQERLVLPFHAGRDLHPKIVKQVMRSIER